MLCRPHSSPESTCIQGRDRVTTAGDGPECSGWPGCLQCLIQPVAFHAASWYRRHARCITRLSSARSADSQASHAQGRHALGHQETWSKITERFETRWLPSTWFSRPANAVARWVATAAC